MKVKDLKKILEDFDDEDLVVLSKDGEGNAFSPLSDYSVNMYVPSSTWDGETYPREFDKEYFDSETHFNDIKADDDTENCITLWPTN